MSEDVGPVEKLLFKFQILGGVGYGCARILPKLFYDRLILHSASSFTAVRSVHRVWLVTPSSYKAHITV
jgi:hypothetical protein